MLALCLMLLATYYALNYSGIIGQCLSYDCSECQIEYVHDDQHIDKHYTTPAVEIKSVVLWYTDKPRQIVVYK